MTRHIYSRILTAGLLIAVATPSAFAQGADDWFVRDKYEAVRERRQPAFDPVPIRVGAFLLDSQLRTDATYDTNVFSAETDETDDVFFGIAPSATLRSNWSRHRLGARAGVIRRQFASIEDESHTDLNAGVFGRLDLGSNLQINAATNVSRTFEPRFAVEALPVATERVEVNQFGGDVEALWTNGRLQAAVAGRAQRLDFSDVPITGGGVFDQDFRDRTELGGSGRVAYAIQRDYAVFAEGGFLDRDHDEATPPALNRDGRDFFIRGGVDFELPVLLRGEVGVGFLRSTFDETALGDVTGVSLAADVSWFVSRLTTVSASASREVRSSGFAESVARTDLDLGVRVDHELRRNVVLYTEGGFTDREFEDIDRNDTVFLAGLGGLYKLNRNIHADLSYRFRTQDSSGLADDRDFVNHTVTFGLVFYP